jgi:hypothetical protein
VDPAVEAERLVFRRGYRDIFVRTIEQGIERGELPPHDVETIGAAIVGALGEALVGPLSNGRGNEEALVVTLVGFCMNAIPNGRWTEDGGPMEARPSTVHRAPSIRSAATS